MNLTLRRIRIVGILFVSALAPQVLRGQSTTPNPWLDFPTYDSTLIWQLRQGADAKAARRLMQDPASVETFTRLAGVGRSDDALMVLKRTLETGDAAQTIAALHALSETMIHFQQDQTR